jgi:hypothetical protein
VLDVNFGFVILSQNSMNTHQRNGEPLSNGGGTDVRITEVQNFLDPRRGYFLPTSHSYLFIASLWGRGEFISPLLQAEACNIILDEFNEIFCECDVAAFQRLTHESLQRFAQPKSDQVGHGFGDGLCWRGHLRES